MNSSTKKIVVIGPCILIVALFAAYQLLFSTGQHENDPTNIIREDTRVEKVFIKDLHKMDEITDQGIRDRVERRLYVHINNDTPDLYTGIIRDGSSSSTVSKRVTTLTFLIDTYPVNITYQATITTVGENSSVTIACAPQEEQIDPLNICEDPEYI